MRGGAERRAEATENPSPRKFIPIDEAFREWEKDLHFIAAYEALEDEFARVGPQIEEKALQARRRRPWRY